jgi:hypothetical protein
MKEIMIILFSTVFYTYLDGFPNESKYEINKSKFETEKDSFKRYTSTSIDIDYGMYQIFHVEINIEKFEKKKFMLLVWFKEILKDFDHRFS